METKKEKIKALVLDMLTESHNAMIKKLDNVLKSGCIDFDSWQEDNAPMVLPKCIVYALLDNDKHQYSLPKGYPNERKIKKEMKDIGYFIN